MAEKLHIDLDGIIRSRLNAGKSRFIPRWATRFLERLIHQEELNDTLDATWPNEGTAFAEAVYRHFDLSLIVNGMENIPGNGRFIFASNHPLGGLDGIGLIKVLGERYGDEGIRFLVNDMLMNVEPLRPVFLPINKYGSQGRAAAAAITEAYGSEKQIIIFPAGLVSRLQPDGSIRDLKWQKSFVQKAIEHKRDIIPIRFEGHNRMRFYKTAYWRKRLGIKVNLEQAMLPAELCAARGGNFSVTFGTPISWQTLQRMVSEGTSPAEAASNIREVIYSL